MLIKGAKSQLDLLEVYNRGSYFLGSDRHVSESDTGGISQCIRKCCGSWALSTFGYAQERLSRLLLDGDSNLFRYVAEA